MSLEEFKSNPKILLDWIYYGNIEAIHHLLLNGFDVNARLWARCVYGVPLLSKAVQCGQLELCKLLVDRFGADVNATHGETSTTVLMDACMAPLIEPSKKHIHFDICKYLIEKGANVNTIDKNGWTALTECVRNGNYDFCKLMLDSGADVNYLNGQGMTVLGVAIHHNQHEIMKLLLSYHPNLHTAKSRDGYDALGHAQVINNSDAVALLKQHIALLNNFV